MLSVVQGVARRCRGSTCRGLTCKSQTCSFNTNRVKTAPPTATAEFEVNEVSLEEARPISQMPGPRRLPFIGSYHTTLARMKYDRRFIVQSHLKLFHKYGPIVRQKYAHVNIIQLFDIRDAEKLRRSEGRYPRLPPMDLFKQISKDMGDTPNIIAADGAEWERQRMALQKYVLKPQVVASFMSAQEKVAVEFVDYVSKARDEKDQVFDMQGHLRKYTVEAIAIVCYAKRLGTFEREGENDPTHDGHSIARNAKILSDRLYPLLSGWPFVKMPGKTKKTYKTFLRSAKHIRSITDRLVRERESGVEAADNLDNCIVDKLLEETEKGVVTRGEAVSLIDQLLWGGVDTTAIALSHVTYQLARHPEVQDKLYEELERELPGGAGVTHEILHTKLKYLRATIREVHRIAPTSVLSYSRRLENDEVFSGYRVPAGCTLMVQTGPMGKLPQYFENPEEFYPDRWMNDQNRELQKMTGLIVQPYGYGKRSCLGRRFAEQEIYLAAIKLVQRFRIEYTGKELGMINNTFGELDGPLNVTLRDR